MDPMSKESSYIFRTVIILYQSFDRTVDTTFKFLKSNTIVPYYFSTKLIGGKPFNCKLSKNSVGNRKRSQYFDTVFKLKNVFLLP